VPTYDYQCRSCGQITEVVHAMTEDGPSTCERCGGALRRVLYPTGIIFKGSGFYVTDSRSSGNGGRRSGSAGKPASAGTAGETSSPEAKPAGGTTPETKGKPDAKPQ
jgi:putative FmdB family regulatory protein